MYGLVKPSRARIRLIRRHRLGARTREALARADPTLPYPRTALGLRVTDARLPVRPRRPLPGLVASMVPRLSTRTDESGAERPLSRIMGPSRAARESRKTNAHLDGLLGIRCIRPVWPFQIKDPESQSDGG